MSEKRTVTLEYPGEDEAGTDFGTWCEVMRMTGAHSGAAPRLMANAYLMGLVKDDSAPRHERLQAAALLVEATK